VKVPVFSCVFLLLTASRRYSYLNNISLLRSAIRLGRHTACFLKLVYLLTYLLTYLLGLQGLLFDAERDLLAIVKFLVTVIITAQTYSTDVC